MSLTSHIANSKSPVRKFLADHFPNTRTPTLLWFESDDQRETLGDSGVTITKLNIWDCGPFLVTPELSEGYPWGTVGTAFDYRVRYLYEVTPVSRLVASHGALMAARHLRCDSPVPPAFVELESALAILLGDGRDLRTIRSPEQEAELCRHCYALALYEQHFRAVPTPEWPLMRLGADATLAQVLELCSPSSLGDLMAMVLIYLECDDPVLSQSPTVLNPTFAGSIELGGADADLILGNTLIDIKTTKKGKPNRPQYWQIVGYALADYTDEYSIDRLGFYYARYGALVTWELADLLQRLAGKPISVERVRSDFRVLLGELPARLARPLGASGVPRLPANFVPYGTIVEREVKFRPPASGSGKWHLPYTEVPGQPRPDDLRQPGRTPACGSKSVLDSKADPITPAVGSKYADADPRLCRRCLGYTWHFYAARWPRQPKPDVSSTWVFRPPVNKTRKWHIIRADMYPSLRNHRNSPICNTGAGIRVDAKSIPFSREDQTLESDIRLCRHCLREARYNASHR